VLVRVGVLGGGEGGVEVKVTPGGGVFVEVLVGVRVAVLVGVEELTAVVAVRVGVLVGVLVDVLVGVEVLTGGDVGVLVAQEPAGSPAMVTVYPEQPALAVTSWIFT